MTEKCKSCGGEIGGFCPGCDRDVCSCCLFLVTVDEKKRYAWRCKECAAELVLGGAKVEGREE